jgi:hypothetical protein
MVQYELEAYMTKESSNAISTSILQAGEAQRAIPSSIDVKGAAKRLGVSTSTVYRLDREHGPIRFLSTMRPITIDFRSLETHVANIKSIERDPELVSDVVPCSCPYEEHAENTEPRTNEVLAEPTHPPASTRSCYPSLRCGQRELALTKRDGAAFIGYFSYI